MRFLARHGIPYYYLPTISGNKGEDEILDLVKNTDFLVLARYMQVILISFFTVSVDGQTIFTNMGVFTSSFMILLLGSSMVL